MILAAPLMMAGVAVAKIATVMLVPPPLVLDPERKRWTVIETLALGFWRFQERESYFLERENDGGETVEVLCVIGFLAGRCSVEWCLSFF